MLELVNLLCCKIGGLPMTYRSYLGMPLVASFKVKSVWNPILEKMEHSIRLEETVFVKRGEVSVIEWCTLLSLPAYYLPLFTILVSVVNRIEKFHRNFLWKGMEISLGRYEGRVQASFGGLGYGLTPIANGGLGFRKLVTFNQALLGKWFMLFWVGGNVAMQICSSCEIWRGVGRLVH